jgi:uncharacterized protein (DUF1697 family)
VTAAPVQIALLRGVMPTGKNRVPMAELRALLEDLGFAGARTLLATGNAVFRSSGPTGAELEALLERKIAEQIGPTLDVMVRDAAQWRRIVAENPFPEDAAERPGKLLAMVLKGRPTAEGARAFEAGAAAPEKAKVIGDVAWLVFSDAGTLLKMTGPAVMKRTLGCSGTGRNWNTVRKIQQAADEMAAG